MFFTRDQQAKCFKDALFFLNYQSAIKVKSGNQGPKGCF
jgi:hypothetical protein